jgi:hypothetical protein
MKSIETLICRECPSNQIVKCPINKEVCPYHAVMESAYRNMERRELKLKEQERRQYERN